MKNLLTEVISGFLNKPGDTVSAIVTPSGRKMLKATTETLKYSVTQYPSTGTVVETITRKIK